ncbi:MAG: pyridoxamine kinase [Eubacteriaceae bacterium]|jgi:pyridoxine kinase|nr:pyridoxamine kinase [Eubacteriaceae bacterium]
MRNLQDGIELTDKRILTIQDISCVGQCSLTVALPIISACGVEASVLPSAVLSTHTSGFTGYTFRDLTEDIPSIVSHWEKENIDFDAIYTGYLGSTKQIDYVIDVMNRVNKPTGLKIVDPAMADHGELYAGFDDTYVKAIMTLCSKADIIIPNITEACFMTGMDFKTEYDRAYIDELLSKLVAIGAGTVILTGVGYQPEKTGVIVVEDGKESYYEHKRFAEGCHGTGDVYASAFVGALMNGLSIYDAARIAADFTLASIEHTKKDADHWYGVKFEKMLPKLIDLLDEAQSSV